MAVGPTSGEGAAGGTSAPWSAALLALCVEYALNAVGLVPHMIFLADFVARGLGRGVEAGARYWVVFGIGAMLGPLLTGHLADRIGFRRALRVALVLQGVAVALPAVTTVDVSLGASSAVVGAFVPGIVPLVLGRVQELIAGDNPARRTAAWSGATTAFALGQAGAAYGASLLFTRSGGYELLFVAAAAAFALALALDLAGELALSVNR